MLIITHSKRTNETRFAAGGTFCILRPHGSLPEVFDRILREYPGAFDVQDFDGRREIKAWSADNLSATFSITKGRVGNIFVESPKPQAPSL